MTTIAVPDSITRLPRDDHGRPVPWFTAIIDGRPDMRVADAAKHRRAIADRRCWICGRRFERAGSPHLAFVVGPLSLFSRCALEPPSHRACALYALRECPFLSNPQRARRPTNLPEQVTMSGEPVLDNPGVMLVWLCHRYDLEHDGAGPPLFRLPMPTAIYAYAEGLPALRTQFDQALDEAEGRWRQLAAADHRTSDDIDTVVAASRRLIAERIR
jgi:hypothetical protein